MSPSLHDTLVAAQRGDRAALDALFARHLPPLVAFLRNRAGGVVVEKESIRDLAQSVCREALQDLEDLDFRSEPAFRRWLFLQATRKILMRHRFHHQERRDAARERAAEDGAGAEGLLACYATLCTPSRQAAAREELGRIEAALEELPDDQRDAVAYSRLLGLDYDDIAARMERSPSAVRGLVARGLARLTTILGSAEP